MSYDVGLYEKKLVKVKPHEEGGTFVLGGVDRAELNITYNYSQHFYRELDREKGLRWLYGKTGEDVIPHLEKAIAVLGVERDSDYWLDTKGNAGYALSILLGWAKQHPTAVFDGD